MEYISLGEICKISAGQAAPKKFEKSGIPFIRAGHLQDLLNGLQLNDLPKVNELTAKKKSLKVIPEGSIIFAKSGMSATKNRIFITPSKSYVVSHLAAIFPSGNINTNYLARFLQWFNPAKLILDEAYPSIRLSEIRDLKIPLPPLSTQKQIASILDQTDRLVQLNKDLIEKYDELAQSIFLEMFGDTYFNQFNWPIKELNDICLNIVDCPHSTPKYVDYKSDFPCIRTTELKNGIINWSSMKYLDEPGYLERIKRLTPEKGDIVYGREGTFGEAVLIPSDCKMSLGQRVVLIRPNTKIVLNEFLLSVLRSRGLYYQALKVNSGSTVGHVNMKDIRKFKIPVPPLDMQERFVEKIKNLKTQVGIIKESSEKGIDLFNSLIQKSFKGELIKSDEYETA